eukprot:CAMPEP_0183720402 /NCGR_PEP_ID=MMETSP0737-20130205/13019_1 /TAXON_ID=385413 /ORGANISM="Thalassiosira miniscula, Strain CCMP1093" /LENGTH=925 /DNA_ID=CAMNT_0025950257 /DNA_START=116 /DNA_END=2893 /DNA_ORIENTATION=-
MSSSYPTSNPLAKHDLLCPSSIIEASSSASASSSSSSSNETTIKTIESLSSSIVQSSIPQKTLPADITKLSTVYTYKDAPTKPKPLSRNPRIWRLLRRSLFDAATDNVASNTNQLDEWGGSIPNSNGNHSLLKSCSIAVKLPANIPPGDAKSTKNSKSFLQFMEFLHTRKLVAVLACDSAGRIGFVVPILRGNGGGGGGGSSSWGGTNGLEDKDDAYFAANLYYAPMKEFLARSKTNYAAAEAKASSSWDGAGDDAGGAGDEPATWTPQYTPPPEYECGPSQEWDSGNGGPTYKAQDDEDELIYKPDDEEPIFKPDDDYGDEEPEPETWTPQYSPPPEEECGPSKDWDNEANNGDEGGAAALFVPGGDNDDNDGGGFGTEGLFVPGGNDNNNDDDGGGFGTEGLFVPGGNDDGGGFGSSGFGNGDGGWDNNNDGGWDSNNNDDNATGLGGWTTVDTGNDNNTNNDDTNNDGNNNKSMNDGVFHANAGAAAADAFYSGLTRSLDTRADSRLYHMRAFNGWVKATQIAELDPDTSRAPAGGANAGGKKRSRNSPMRVLDLACGKGGDLGKWALHNRKLENYVGVDVARGSLVDAAIRARQMSKKKSNPLRKCTFTLADLGEDVPGRKRSKYAKRMQRLLTWSMQNETPEEKGEDPAFAPEEGGGIDESDKFDVVSIQFAIHYMMSTRKRARRFFNTVSSLLEIGGNLIATTIDARVVAEKLMGLGLDFHFDEYDAHTEVDTEENEQRHNNGNKRRKVVDGKVNDRGHEEPAATVAVGNGVCRLKFDTEILRKVFQPPKTPEDMFGLQYTFTLVEGSDHAAGVGEAVDLPEWLTPIPALEELAEESGLRLEYATNFHKFFQERKNPQNFPMAHNALYNMKVLNRDGSLSAQEWDVSRMYIALKFRKVKESTITFEGEMEDLGEEELRE